MARSGVVALSFAVLLAIVEIGSSLECYQCNSNSDPACGDPFSGTKYAVECSSSAMVNYNRAYLAEFLPGQIIEGTPGSPKACHKLIYGKTVVRTCLDANPGNLNVTCMSLAQIWKPVDPTKQLLHCSACDKKDCNGAASVSASIPLAILALFASYLYFK